MNQIKNLLQWCKNHTDGYDNVNITNFTSSWHSGLAFCALIHRFKPDLIDYHKLEPDGVFYNNFIAFKVAETHFGIPALLDAKDMAAMSSPEKLSIITYVSQFYNCLKDMDPEGGPDINKFENDFPDTEENEFRRINARASVCRLTQLKCAICRKKVYILERYVADDKLYHRVCYRQLQLEHLDENQTESSPKVIGNFLNIYGELKPNMNKNIFKHPLLNEKLDNENEEQHTIEPEPEQNLEINKTDETVKSVDINDHSEYKNIVTNEPVELEHLSDTEFSEITDETMSEQSSIISEEAHVLSDIEHSQAPSQENMVPNIAKISSLKPLKPRLYVKKKDKNLPYSTFFELSACKQEPTELYSADNVKINEPPEVKSRLSSIKYDEDLYKGRKKLIKVNFMNDSDNESDEIFDESDLESIENVPKSETVEPRLVRNSIWRKPIISHSNLVTPKRFHNVTIPSETKYQDYLDFKKKLQSLNKKQAQIELHARLVQQKLWEEEDPDSERFESLLSEWLHLVEEKDKLFYEENVLYAWIKDVKLQDTKRKLELEIRKVSTDNPEKEQQLIKQLVDTVNKRSDLVEEIHEEKLMHCDMVNARQLQTEIKKKTSINNQEKKLVTHQSLNVKYKYKRPTSSVIPNQSFRSTPSASTTKTATKTPSHPPSKTDDVSPQSVPSSATNDDSTASTPSVKTRKNSKSSKLKFWKHKSMGN